MKLLSSLLIMVFLCTCSQGPMGEQGTQGERGETGLSNTVYWRHTITPKECEYSSELGSYYVVIEDVRFEHGSFYQIWWEPEEGVQANLETYYSDYTGIYYYLKIVIDGVLMFTADADIAGWTILILKIDAMEI